MGICFRRAEIEARAVVAVTDLPDFVEDPLFRPVVGGWILPIAVDGGAVSVGDRTHIERGLGPAFDLEARDAGVHQFGDVLDEAHVLRIEEVGTVLSFGDLEVLAGALLFHQMVLPAARLGAFAPVAVPAGHVVRQEAAAGDRHAHGAVDEGFDLEVLRSLCPHFPDLFERALPGHDDPSGAHLIEGVRGQVVDNTRLSRHVDVDPGGVLLSQFHDAHVRDDERVDAGVFGG